LHYFCFLLYLPWLKIKLQHQTAAKIWSAEKANAWYAKHKWISGSNFTPSTAITNWKCGRPIPSTPKTIDRELGYAEGIGFTAMRVFLHSIAWKEDPKGFKSRINQYLAIADKHHIQTIFVFLMIAGTLKPNPVSQPDPNRCP